MKKISTFFAVALLALCSMPVQAQEDMFFETNFPELQTPTAHNFYPLWLDGGTKEYYGVTPYIVQDLTPNGEYQTGGVRVGDRFFDIWPAGDSFVVQPCTSNGAFGQNATGYYDMQSQNLGWAGGGFNLLGPKDAAGVVTPPPPIDLTAIDDDYRFHMDVRKTDTNPIEIWLTGGGDATTGAAATTQQARFFVGVGTVGVDGAQNITPGFVTNKWYVIDIPVSTLRTLSNTKVAGWDNLAPIKSGYYLAFQFGGNNINFQLDGVFYYKPGPPPAAVDNNKAGTQLIVKVTNSTVNILNATTDIDVYNIAGAKVKTCTKEQPVFGTDELSAGVYIIKSGNAVAKVVIK